VSQTQAGRDATDETRGLVRRRARPAHKPLAAIELALRDSEARYRELVQSLPIAFYATDADGRVTLYNEAAVELWGRTPVLGEDRWCGSHRMFHPDGSPMPLDRCPMALSIREGATMQGTEAIVERPDASRRNVLVYPQVFRDTTGRVTGAVNALVDITERKAAEAELIRGRESLREQDQRKDVFLATLAHELRNPLTPVRNAMHVIRLAGDTRAAVAQTRAMIERQLAQLVRLVDDLLDVSRISRGKIELRKERVELQAVLRQAVETSSALVDHYGHSLQLALPPSPVFVFGDPARLAQVFSNLLNNAAKYTPPRGRIAVELRGEGDRLEVSVSDNGIGLPQDMLGHVFEMFTQVDASLDKSRGGLGVGLAIVRRLVEMHGGRVEARSDGPGSGSTFVVHLSRSHEEGAPESARQSRLPSMRSSSSPSHRRILVVDDNVDLADSLAMMLRMLGHEVRVAHDGAAAIAATETFAPDLVFLDIGMPRMNGYETCRQMRQTANGKEAVVVALSGWGQDHDKQRSREAGMDLHLVKPFDPALLESMLADLDARPKVAEDAPPSAATPSAESPGLAAQSPPAPDNDEDLVGTPDAEMQVEAARYALFRRILPVLRHGLAGELQSVQFAVSLARRSFERTHGGRETADAIARIGEQATAAIGRGQQITDGLRPDPNATSSVGDAVHACLDLVGTEWSLRGIEVDANVPQPGVLVRSAAFRELLAAMLVALGDALPGAADVELAARKRGDELVVSLRAREAPRDGDGIRVSLYRDFRWSDFAALAQAHGIAWARHEDRVLMRVALA